MNRLERVQFWQRRLLVLVVFAGTTVVAPGALKPFMLPKATVIFVVATLIVTLAAARAVMTRRLYVPVSATTWAVLALLLALTTSAVTSRFTWTSVVGFYDRYAGFLTYGACLVVFLALMAGFDHRLMRHLTHAWLIALGVVAGYGLLQAAGVDPFGWQTVGLGRDFSTFGNVDFAAAWVGSSTGLALVLALDRSAVKAWRWYSGLLLVASLGYIFVSGTSQGLVVALISIMWVLVAVWLQPNTASSRLIRKSPGAAGVLLVAFLVAVVLLMASATHVIRAQLDQALVERPAFWAAAVDVFLDHPVLGSGLATYGHYFLQYRPPSHGASFGGIAADAPHSVPLAMLAEGGVMLGVAYACVVAIVGIALVIGTFRSTGRDRLALAGYGGAWLGYQAQSLVSVDVPPLVLLHWLSAGVIVAVAAPPTWRSIELPGAPARGMRSGPPTQDRTVITAPSKWLLAGLVLSASAVVWLSLYPLRADMAARDGALAAKSGQSAEALNRLEAATRLYPGEARYPSMLAEVQADSGALRDAYESAVNAARLDPGYPEYALQAAMLAQRLENAQDAADWFRRAIQSDPHHPELRIFVARQLIGLGHHDAAEAYLSTALALEPENAEARALLEQITGQA